MISAHFLHNKSATLLFLIESRLFIKRGIDYHIMAAKFTEDLIQKFFQGDVHSDLPEATTADLVT